jgi:hypothetical protein
VTCAWTPKGKAIRDMEQASVIRRNRLFMEHLPIAATLMA